jgi:uncharacterized damage-inducible protein DinB
MQPDEARFLLDFLLPRLKSEKATTMKILSAVPPDKGAFKPHPRSMSSLQLSWHIVTTEMWFLDAVIGHVFKEDDLPMPPELRPGADIARWYDENFAQRLPRLEGLSGGHLVTPVNYIGLLNDPAVAYLSFAICHSVHHRGQLSAYLRPMGAKVPAIYVESADEPFPPATHTANS